MKLFSNLNQFIYGYFDPKNMYFFIIKIKNFPGDLSNISAKVATLSSIPRDVATGWGVLSNTAAGEYYIRLNQKLIV